MTNREQVNEVSTPLGLFGRIIEKQGANAIGWMLLVALLWYAGKPLIDNHFKFIERIAAAYEKLVEVQLQVTKSLVGIERNTKEQATVTESMRSNQETVLIPATKEQLQKLDEIKSVLNGNDVPKK